MKNYNLYLYDLYLFDLDDTLIVGYMGREDKNYALVEALPGRGILLNSLYAAGKHVAIVTNQAGVAFGYNTEADWEAKMCEVADLFSLPSNSFHYCYAHPGVKPLGTTTRPCWDYTRRKPSGAMLLEAMAWHRVDKASTCMIGDMSSDREAAQAAGVTYYDVKEFFGDA